MLFGPLEEKEVPPGTMSGPLAAAALKQGEVSKLTSQVSPPALEIKNYLFILELPLAANSMNLE